MSSSNFNGEFKDLVLGEDQSDSEGDELLTDEDQDEVRRGDRTSGRLGEYYDEKDNSRRKSFSSKLLLCRAPWLLIGILILATGVILSQYHVHLPYQPSRSACGCNADVSHNTSIDQVNFTNSTNNMKFEGLY